MDTASKRFSAIHIALPFRGAGYLPDGSTDRQAAAFMYEGISAVPPAPPVPIAKPGGIGHGKRKKYPRRISVDGRIYNVRSESEEAELLRQMAERASDQAKIARAGGDEVTATRAAKKADKLEARAFTAEEMRAAWIKYLQQEDEEILLIAA
jgi:hypothetical protein